MSDRLDIGASRRRGLRADERIGEDPGECAWDLSDPRTPPGEGAALGSVPEPLPELVFERLSEPASEPTSEPAPVPASGPGPRSTQPGPERAERYRSKPLGAESDTPANKPAPQPASPFAGLPGFGEEEPEGSQGPALDIMRFVRGVWSRKWIVAAIAAIVSLSFLILALAMPHRWQATATLITQTHQDQIQVSGVPPFKPQEYALSTFVDTVKLPSSLDETMKRIGVRVMRETLGGAIEVKSGKDSKIFFIRATWDNPVTAAQIANTVTDLFIENSARIRRRDAERSFDDYSAQLREARATLDRSGKELAEYEKRNGIANIDDQVAVLVKQVSELDASYRTRSAEAEATREALVRVSAQLAQEPEMVVTSSRYRSPFKQRLSEFQWELKEARTRYTDANPKIVRLQKRIATLEQLIAESKDEVAPENVYEINPKRAELTLRQQEMESRLKIVDAQSAANRRSLEDAQAKLESLTLARSGHQELVAQVHDAERLANILAARISEVRAAMLPNAAGFSIVERATPPALPLPSARKLVAAAGLVLGCGLGLAVALALELRDPWVRTLKDAQTLAGCELAFELPDIGDSAKWIIDPTDPGAAVSVLFRSLANDLASALAPKEWRSLAVVGAEPHCGRTFVALNLAIALGLKEEHALIVDADLRTHAGHRPAEHLGLEEGEPLGTLPEVLTGRMKLEDAVTHTPRHHVDLLHSGPCESDEQVLLLGSRAFRDLALRLAREPIHVLYNLPPLKALESVAEAAAAVGNVLLVARSGHTARKDLKDAADRLRSRGVEIRAVAIIAVPERLASRSR